MTTTNHRWPANLYAPTEAERCQFGGRWVYTGDLLPHSTEVLVAQYPDPKPSWQGHAVDVYCTAYMAARYYRIAAQPGYQIEINQNGTPQLAAAIASAIWNGVMVVKTA